MEIFIFIALAALWGLVLLPTFLGSRKDAPINTTQSFARDAARIHAVRVRAVEGNVMRRRVVLARRRRALVALAGLAFATLIAAIYTGSFPLLLLNIGMDVALAAYIAILLQIKQSPRVVPDIQPAIAPTPGYEQAQIRVVAG